MSPAPNLSKNPHREASGPSTAPDAVALIAGQLIPERRVELARELRLTGAAAASPGPVAVFVEAVRSKGIDERQLVRAIGHRELKQVASDLGLTGMGFDREALEKAVLEQLDPNTARETRRDHISVDNALPTDLSRMSLEQRADSLQLQVDRLKHAHRFVLGLGAFGFGLGILAMISAHGSIGMPFYLATHFIVVGVLMERFDLSPAPTAILFGLATVGCAIFLVAYSLPGAFITLSVLGAVTALHRKQRLDLPT